MKAGTGWHPGLLSVVNTVLYSA